VRPAYLNGRELRVMIAIDCDGVQEVRPIHVRPVFCDEISKAITATSRAMPASNMDEFSFDSPKGVGAVWSGHA
jgi:hypothetical protein